MKQTAVEWLEKQLDILDAYKIKVKTIIEYAKEMEKQQQDEFAIGFAEWLVARELGFASFKLNDGVLEIYKKEKGL